MSLTEDITALTAEARNLVNTFNAKSAAIDAKVDTAISEMSNSNITIWVDPAGGDDSNAGMTAQTAVATPEKAITLVSGARRAQLNLLGDVVLQKATTNHALHVILNGVDNNGDPVDRRFRFADESVTSPQEDGQRHPAFIGSPGNVTFDVRNVTLELPDVPDDDEWIKKVIISEGQIDFFARSSSVEIANSDSAVALVGSWGGPVGFWASNLAFSDDVAGHLIEGVADGEDPNSYAHIRSNLTSA
ncbi:hypothetical protein [Flexibacterium corallicola]|uniref:hypothetical protein n=1 Tax=Flexibacterium corallicola TaxID=3037259 RepID=UPI00286EEC21|nr:hypothetical protein [Pseudovibrio sp. M1P-2-3]